MANKLKAEKILSNKNSRILQATYPIYDLGEALRVPRAIKDNFAGQPTAPLLVAEACNVSPTSSNWRYLSGAAAAYGLTDGAYNSKEISLTNLGERIVSPIKEGDDVIALKDACLVPTILGKLYKQYDNNKIPKVEILKNILQKEGIPTEKLDSAVEIFRSNAKYANISRIISGNEFIFLKSQIDSESVKENNTVSSTEKESKTESQVSDIPSELLEKMNIQVPIAKQSIDQKVVRAKPFVFISHGKNSKIIVGQLKELLSYGQMEPIVSVDRETTAVSVPDKVFDDMRNCDAGIIHVDIETFDSEDGQSFSRLNENVLIEIGAAIALYGKKVILLCKSGIQLPSNLQGLYRCEYEGNQLDYPATMKILKTLQELRNLVA